MESQSDPVYVDFAQVRERLGITRQTLYARIRSESIPVYSDPRDRRRRLIHASYLPKLVHIRLASQRVGDVAA